MNRESVEKIECLIIDEISMVRADLFDAIDMTLRRSKNDNRPFGGISVIIVGDPYQLDPVLKKDEEPPFYHGKEYKGPYFFQSKAFNEFIKENKFTAYRLTKNFRADEDPYYASLLEKIRVGEDLRNSVKVLNSNCRRDVSESEDFGLFLTSINKDADRINKQKLSILPSEEQLFEGVLEGKYYNENTDSFPAPKLLELKVGAKVIFISNDEERRWVNGSQGLIKLIPDDKTFIQIEIDGKTYDVYRHKWEKLKYIYDEEYDEFYTESVGSFSHFPIKLGWALTIP
jgi:ATP-dependent exoDNAse (exonuclease V), alpha subunit - helicase superfamily I member